MRKHVLPRSHALFPPTGEVAGALARIEASDDPEAAKLAVQFLALTAKRLCEMRRATWVEMDLEARTFVSARNPSECPLSASLPDFILPATFTLNRRPHLRGFRDQQWQC
ncbi:MAG: hypothetical protein F4220_13195 [Gammaproteobacteria bacterium]|nr:hypothetical protein [Gammaproteobacteria bacterium]MYB40080.1 hypothetical protein [Candidatus Saccharibacteria bacterium]MYF51087.1 hypothetical protein [Gammaproteobacteria bacterium]